MYGITHHNVSISRSPITISNATGQRHKTICIEEACHLSKDIIAEKLYGIVSKVHQFFFANFGLNGVDGKGWMPPFVIHWDEKNAQWSCEAGRCLFRFHDTYALEQEVVAHEYMHAVINYLHPIQYKGESGALNESIADVMGIVFKHWSTGQIDWQISGIRNISIPPSSYHYNDMVEDNGGVHTKSAIPNHAFFLAAQAIRIDTLAKIWFLAFQRVSYTPSFNEFAKATINVAKELDASNQLAVQLIKAWVAVYVIQATMEVRSEQKWDWKVNRPIVIETPIYRYI